jgi:glycosyltransferase involved in cell wall biosynthesis
MVVTRIINCPCPPAQKIDPQKIPLISIIIPAHNAERTIEKCLQAIKEQNYASADIEIIVIDDASNDHTKEIVQRFPVQLIQLSQNMGAARARNYAGDVAHGTYIFFLDSDVILVRNAIEHLVQVLQQEKPDALVGSYTELTTMPGFFNNYQNCYTFFNHDQPTGRIYWFWTAIGVIKRDVFIEMGGFSTRYRGASAEDMDLGYRLADAGKLTLLDQQVKGEHRHHHTLGSIVRNDYVKAAAWGELYLRTKRSSEYKHTFTGWVNQATLFGVWMMLGFAILGLLWVQAYWFILGLFIFLVLLNSKFYGFIIRKKGFFFAIGAVLFHFFTYIPIGLGSMKALWRFLTRRDF